VRKEELREYQAELMESLEKERAQVQELMSFIGNNFTSLAQLQSSGITDIQQLFVYATQKDMQAINSTFSLLSGKTQEVGNLYTSTVNASIGATFDYGVQRAEDALRALNRAIGRANEKASEIERSLERQSSNSNTYNTRNSTYNITNPYLDADQIARKIQDSLYDPY